MHKELSYADDLILLAENEDDLQRLLYKLGITSHIFNMRTSVEKTQSMVISKDPIRRKLAVDNKIIQQVTRFKYPGVPVASERNLIEEARTQTIKATRIVDIRKISYGETKR